MQQRIRQAGLPECNEVGRLFNEYRVFYNQNADIEAARQYIKERMERHDSVILVAETDVESDQGKDDCNAMPSSHGLSCTDSFSCIPVSVRYRWGRSGCLMIYMCILIIVRKALQENCCKQPSNWHLSVEFFVYHSLLS